MFMYFPGWKRSDRLHLCSQIKKRGLSGFVFRGPGTFQLPPPKHHFFSGSFLLLFFPLLFLPCTLSSSHTLFLSVPVPPLLLFFPLLLAVYDRREHTVHTHTAGTVCLRSCLCTQMIFCPLMTAIPGLQPWAPPNNTSREEYGKKNCQAMMTVHHSAINVTWSQFNQF